MKQLHFDVFAGISGDMTLGALLDAGCPLDALVEQLSPMGIPGFALEAEAVMRGVLRGTKVHVSVQEEPHVHRSLKDVLDIVDRVTWPDRVRQQIELAFTELAHAEGKIHNRPYDTIHFHEVGSFDAIIDICASLFAIHIMEIDSITCSRIHVGTGLIEGTRHGTIPAPGPATLELLKGFQIYSTGISCEMITPTGAALLKTLAGESTPLPEMQLETMGYGAGTRNTNEIANLLRILIGETTGKTVDRIVVIEANIDDMNPEWMEPLFEHLLANGALDVTLTPVQMKKQRNAIRIEVIAPISQKEVLATTLLKHSTSIGVRMQEWERRMLKRRPIEVQTPLGTITGKVCWGEGIAERFTPEYDSCRRIASEKNLPIASVYETATLAYHQQHPVN